MTLEKMIRVLKAIRDGEKFSKNDADMSALVIAQLIEVTERTPLGSARKVQITRDGLVFLHTNGEGPLPEPLGPGLRRLI